MIDTVGISILAHLPLGVDHVKAPGRHCSFVGLARQGELLWAAGQEITCPLARFNLGLDPPNRETIDKLAGVIVEWECARDVEIARSFVKTLSPLPFGQRVFVYGPLSKMPFPPDLVLLILTPQRAMEHLLAITTASGELSESPVGGLGALCGECTTVPLLTEKAVVSPGCPGSRREAFLAEDQLFLSVPCQLYSSTIAPTK
jgi:uncharacterized protein (DUF169 family)